MSSALELKYNQPVDVPPGFSAVNNNTKDGSPSLVTIKNISAANNAFVSLTLGQKAVSWTIPPKEVRTYPEDRIPKNFQGLPLNVGNNTPPGTEATINVTLTQQ